MQIGTSSELTWKAGLIDGRRARRRHLYCTHRLKADITPQTYRNGVHSPRLPHTFGGRGRVPIKLGLILETQRPDQALDLHRAICFSDAPPRAVAENEEGTFHALELFGTRVEPASGVEDVRICKDGGIVVQGENGD